MIYVYRPILATGQELLSLEDGLIPTETKVSVRVTRRFINNIKNNENGGFPKYSFSTNGLAASEGNNTDIASSALDLINVVPNPLLCLFRL